MALRLLVLWFNRVIIPPLKPVTLCRNYDILIVINHEKEVRFMEKEIRMRDKYLFLPEVATDGMPDTHKAPAPSAECKAERKNHHPCPCCGCLTFPVPQNEAIAYICPVCFWENDVFIESDEEPSDENHGMSLNEARENYQKIGACSENMLVHVRKPRPEEISK